MPPGALKRAAIAPSRATAIAPSRVSFPCDALPYRPRRSATAVFPHIARWPPVHSPLRQQTSPKPRCAARPSPPPLATSPRRSTSPVDPSGPLGVPYHTWLNLRGVAQPG